MITTRRFVSILLAAAAGRVGAAVAARGEDRRAARAAPPAGHCTEESESHPGERSDGASRGWCRLGWRPRCSPAVPGARA